MRARWKILGGTGIASIAVATLVLSQTREVKGDTTASSDSTVSSPPAATPTDEELGIHDPTKPYPLGPGAIEYEQLSAADQAAVDEIQERVETTQPPSSHAAWAAATAYTGERAEIEIAARGVGLEGTDDDGVVP